MKVLVLWADDRSTNLGVRALASGSAELARQAWPGAEVQFQGFGPGSAPVPVDARALAGSLVRVRRELTDWLSGFDVVLDTRAGDSFADIYGLKRLGLMTTMTALAARAGAAVVMGPQTIGPFGTAAGRRTGRYALRKADLVMARDTVSAGHAARLGRPVDVLTTDVAFALPTVPRTGTRDVLLNVSGLLWLPGQHVAAESYRSVILDLHRRLLAAGRRVSLLAHVIDSDNPDNDVPAAREVAAAVDPAAEIIVPTSLGGVRDAVASAEVVIASRMHACLNAISVGTPAIPLAYSRKFAPLFEDLGWEHTIDLRTGGDIGDRAFALAQDEALVDQVSAVRGRAQELVDVAVKHLATHVGPRGERLRARS